MGTNSFQIFLVLFCLLWASGSIVVGMALLSGTLRCKGNFYTRIGISILAVLTSWVFLVCNVLYDDTDIDEIIDNKLNNNEKKGNYYE